MTYVSPTAAFVSRLTLRKDSSMAAARAIDEAAGLLHVSGFARRREARRLQKLSNRIEACATTFHFRVVNRPHQPTEVRISQRRSCRSRLCPLCSSWAARKASKKINAILDEIFTVAPAVRAIFLTLTLPTQRLQAASLAPLQKALKRFWAMPEVRAHTLGQFHAIEAKLSGTRETPTLHFHAHGLIFVPADFFATGVPRVHQTVWARWWQTAARLSRKPVVDVRAVRGPDGETDPATIKSVSREVAKYAISTTVFEHSDGRIRVDPDVALALHTALHGKRLVRFDRCFKDAEKRLKRKAKTEADPTQSGATP